jgi:hypothetical protein
MTNQIKIQIVIALAVVALGAGLAFTGEHVKFRAVGAVIAALGLVYARHVLRGVRRD